MRIAVTGASGNLGSATLRRIERENQNGTGISPPAHHVLGISRRAPQAEVPAEWLEFDLSRESETGRLAEALKGYDAVVHFAWKLQPAHDQDELWRTNVLGTRVMLAAAAKAGVGRIVVASSVGAYSPGPKHAPVPETWPVEGISTSSYSRQKAEVEAVLDEFEREHPGIALVRLRPGLVFQSGAAGEIARLFLGPLVPTRLVGMVKPPVLPVPRQMIFQAVHADDVAAAVWLLLNRGERGAFNVAAGPVLTPDHLARAVGARRSVPFPLVALRGLAAATWRARLQPTEPGWIDLAARCPVMSTARLRALGWTEAHSSTQALAELVAGMRAGSGNDLYPPLVGRRLRPGRSQVRTGE